MSDPNLGKNMLLVWAAQGGEFNEVKRMVSEGADVNFRDRHTGGFTALHYASGLDRDLNTMQYLLDHGADPNSGNNIGDRPLMLAALFGDTEAMDLLVLHGADIDAPNDRGTTALMYAVENGMAETTRWLLGHGAKVDVIDSFGETALSLARKSYWCDDADRQDVIGRLERLGAPDAPPASPELINIRRAIKGPMRV
jgi:ankyrin repeat protein